MESWGDELKHDIDTEVDVEFEYKEITLKFQCVPVTGSVESGLATYWETSWSEIDLHVHLTPSDVQEWVVEQLVDDGQPVPPWAYTDGSDILDEIRSRAKAHASVG